VLLLIVVIRFKKFIDILIDSAYYDCINTIVLQIRIKTRII